MSRARLIAFVLLMLAWALGCQAQTTAPFTVMGIGGAGGIYTPAVSPADPNVMFLSCDMSGTYRSQDGGKTWAMLHWRQMCDSLDCRPAFVGNAIYWASGNILKVSRDQGSTWSVVGGTVPWKAERVQSIAGSESDASTVLMVATEKRLCRSDDSGRSWTDVANEKYNDLLILAGRIYGISGGAVMYSVDQGRTWKKASLPTDAGDQSSLAGAVDAHGNVCLFVTGPKSIIRSADQGQTWEIVDRKARCNMIRMAAGQRQVVYAAQANGKEVWITRDGGQSWQACFHMNGPDGNVQQSWVQTDLHWGYTIMPLGLEADPVNPSVALISTQGDFYITHDAGQTWQQRMNQPVQQENAASPEKYRCNGLEVTSSWEYLFDPFDKDRTYISYTDIGFCRSLDRGKSWISAVNGCPWQNTFYQVIFDRNVKGRLYAACSTRHDIPNWWPLTANSSRDHGGVCVSDDYGAHWHPLGTGLPNIPCTSICQDYVAGQTTPILYAAMYEGGVYKSADGGKTWINKSNGLSNPGNLHVFMVNVQPSTHELFCSITGRRKNREFPVAGGVWKSTDGGDHWVNLTADLDLRWATGFAVNPSDSKQIYLAAASTPGFAQGGLYKTSDGGAHWQHVVTDAELARSGGLRYAQCMFVTLGPDDSNEVFLSTASHGLWVSKNAGQTWQRIEAMPFISVAKVSFDPTDLHTMYIATHGGGVWKGPTP